MTFWLKDLGLNRDTSGASAPSIHTGAPSTLPCPENLRILVCDNDAFATTRLIALLSRLSGVQVVGSVSDGRSALQAITSSKPDLVLSDVDLPDMRGFDLAEAVQVLSHLHVGSPLVAFVTANPVHAAEAFDCGATDCMTKPVRLGRLDQAINKARRVIDDRTTARHLLERENALAMLSQRTASSEEEDSHVWVAKRGETIRLDLNKVDRISAEGAYVRLHVEGTSFLHRQSLLSIEQHVSRSRFLRVHRSHLVRLGMVTSVRRTVHGGSELILRSGVTIPLGRNYAKESRKRLFSQDSALSGVA